MKHLLPGRALLATAVIAVSAGCASYWRDRVKDLSEMGGVRGTSGTGFALTARGTSIARTGVAAFGRISGAGVPAVPGSRETRGWGLGLAAVGLGGHVRSFRRVDTGESLSGGVEWGYEWFGNQNWPTRAVEEGGGGIGPPGQGAMAQGHPSPVRQGSYPGGTPGLAAGESAGEAGGRQAPSGPAAPFVLLPWDRDRRFFDIGAGIHPGLSGIEIFINPYQILDFTLGWFGLDVDADSASGVAL